MKNMIKKILVVFIIAIISISVIASADEYRVIDNANLFSSDEKVNLESSIRNIADQYNIDAVIVTENNIGNKKTSEYADDFYDQHGYGYDDEYSGILLLIDMGNRELYISTTGKCINYFTDERLDNIEDKIYAYLSQQNYYQGAESFLNGVTTYMEAGIESNQYTYDSESALKEQRIKAALIAFLAATIIPGIICFLIAHGYGSPKSERANVYIKEGSLNFLSKKDQFITTHTTKTKIQTNNNSGGSHPGRSTTHTSSSGRSHGGSGRKF